MRVSQLLLIVPVLIQAVLSIAVCLLYWLEQWKRQPFDGLAGVYRAQFELPLLFYAASLFAYALRIVDVRLLFFATLFAVSQATATVVALRSQEAATSTAAQFASVLAVGGLWAMIGWQLFNSGF